jgi:plastocyanin
MRRLRFAVALAASALVVVAVAGAAGPQLNGSVGPDFTISLEDAGGAEVTHLDPGEFSLVVDDKSDFHNFHVKGPGVDVATGIETEGRKTFPVNLVNGTYTFVCDAHPGDMRGSFTVGEVAPTPTPTPTPSPTKPVTRLTLTVTSKTVRLTTPAGKPVTRLPAGRAVVTVRDRSAMRGARLVGAGVRRSTTVAFVGMKIWTVQLTKGTLVFGSDARKPVLRGGRVSVS